ncbi:TetR/AcrR family transcriptional regulator [Effusibacillus consociatus]|uniref:TetR/AcrR family transcriptional regulator n=1 Tax=Effusibacillus consociatus TaxID=1117041 RepID=UPI0036D2519B
MKTKHQLKAEQTIKKLKKAAYELFIEKGFSHTSIDDIVKKAGFTKGAFYIHFKSKEEIFTMIMNERMLIQQTDLRTIEPNSIEQHFDIRKIIEQKVEYMLKATESEHWTPMFLEFVANCHRLPQEQNNPTLLYEEWRKEVEKHLLNLKQKGLIDPVLPLDLLATTIIAIFDGFNIQSHIDHSINPKRQLDVILFLIGSRTKPSV